LPGEVIVFLDDGQIHQLRHGWDDPFALLARAIEQTRTIISHIRPDQASLPTPCTEWDARALVNHTVFDTQNFTAAVSGGQRPSADMDLIGTNWTDAYGTASGTALAVWRQRGTAGVLQLGRGGRCHLGEWYAPVQ
jgi:uncharacterized protein (TIGR03086 family)